MLVVKDYGFDMNLMIGFDVVGFMFILEFDV